MNHLDHLATAIADEYICSCCHEAVVANVTEHMRHHIKDTLERQPHADMFEALFKALDPHERKFADMLRGIWDEQRRIIIANLKKLKKARGYHITDEAYKKAEQKLATLTEKEKRELAKKARGSWKKDVDDKVDQVMYPEKPFIEKLSKESRVLLTSIVAEMGDAAIADLGVDVAFDINNPEVQKWLKSYSLKFANKFEDVSRNKLRKLLTKMIESGEGVPQMIKKLNLKFDEWNKYRSEMVARTESIRASNKASVMAYRQAGITKKVWVTYHDKRTCDWCADMDGKIIGVEDNYFKDGDDYTVGGNTMHMTYEDVGEPPLHVMCRCAIAAITE